jgi:preprotein translocase subunit SecE
MADKIKFALALVLLVAGIAGLYLLSEQQCRFACAFGAGWCLLGCSLVAGKRSRASVFCFCGRESWIEAKKVVWPSAQGNCFRRPGIGFRFVLSWRSFSGRLTKRSSGRCMT